MNRAEALIRPSDVQLAQRLVRLMDGYDDERPDLQTLAARVGLSPSYIQRVFKRVMGLSPREYMEARRLDRFKARLRNGERVSDALYDAGYQSSSRVYDGVSEKMGMTPAVYGRGGAGMELVYAIVDSRLGRLLVATTTRGIASVHLADPRQPDCDAELEAVLRAEYPLATLYRNRETFCNWVATLLDYLNGGPDDPAAHRLHALPLDVQATAFQSLVWNELRKIPVGQTRTYGEIAEAIGHPNAAQAVAAASRDNPVAVLIPCHRAERRDGEVSKGYSPRARFSRNQLIHDERRNARSVGEQPPVAQANAPERF
jgi:AraC family transcriptional regulator of adaptative response/methylated-DNA-[protein]-cysteine methyltransferase